MRPHATEDAAGQLPLDLRAGDSGKPAPEARATRGQAPARARRAVSRNRGADPADGGSTGRRPISRPEAPAAAESRPGATTPPPAEPAPSGTSHDEPSDATASAAAVRDRLALTPHQLSELTAGLRLDIGPRPNYPRYSLSAIAMITCVVSLRATRTPLEVAMRAARDYHPQLEAGLGWLLVAPGPDPAGDRWTVAYAAAGEDLLSWVSTSGGRGTVLDLRVLHTQTQQSWERVRQDG